MIVFKYIFWIFYRIWFYILVALPIIILFPLLFVSLLKESWYPFFFKLARFWAKCILIGMGLPWKVTYNEPLEKGKSYMFIANHVSMVDIMLMLVAVKHNPFVFVGKKELVKIPIFGFFYKRSSILVDRNNADSRKGVYLRAQKRLDSGLSICIFPEGGVPDESVILDDFKDGAFRLAINHKIPIVPMSFYDNKKRFSWTFFSGGPGLLRVKVHNFIETKSYTIQDTKTLKDISRELLFNDLKLDFEKKHKKVKAALK